MQQLSGINVLVRKPSSLDPISKYVLTEMARSTMHLTP